MAAFIAVNFRSAHAELRVFVDKSFKKALTVSCFRLTKQKGSVVLILLALQSNSTGSVLINDGTLGAGELKPGVVVPTGCVSTANRRIPKINLRQ